MRIGIDARLTYYSQAGISRYIQHLVHQLPRLDPTIDWTIIQSRKDSRTLVKGLRVNAWTPCHHRLERWTLGGELLRHRLNLLHSPDFIPPAFGAQRVVITVHDLSFVHFSRYLAPEALRYYAGQIEWAIGRADHILADSNQTREDLVHLLGALPDKVTTVYLAADERFRPLSTPADQMPALQRYDLSPGYILFVGTLEPRKNIPTLLAAYRRLLDRSGTRVPLVLVGKRGWSADDIFETLETLQLGRQVRIIDDCAGQEPLVQLYNGAGVLVLPSFYEGFGLPVLEAMACGTPVVAAHRGSLPEIVGDAGLLINPEDADGLASAIERVLEDDRLRSDLIRRGYAHASRFTWAETARQTLRVYRRLRQEVD
jgi:glycosyltransferase involved in cell wall biosynthesis